MGKTMPVERFLGVEILCTQRTSVLPSSTVVNVLMLLKGLGILGKVIAAWLSTCTEAGVQLMTSQVTFEQALVSADVRTFMDGAWKLCPLIMPFLVNLQNIPSM